MPTTFIPVPGTPEGVKRMLDQSPMPLVLVSRHGLGDNLFFSPCFQPLESLFGQLYFCSSVNAYASIFHDSDLVRVLYAGGVNGSELGLGSALGFCRHFEQIGLDLDVPAALAYHFGLFEPQLPYSDERAFVKGRRNYVELFETGPFAIDVPRYHAAPDGAAQGYIAQVIDRWLPERKLIAIARYGHTDGGKNFGDDWRDTLRTVELLDERFPGRFKYLSLDYTPGDHAADGHAPHVRSVYGLAYNIHEVDIATDESRWDVVTFFDSLEHFSDFAVLRRLFARTRYLLVSLPWAPPTFPADRRWKHYKPGEHLHYFTAASLAKLIAKPLRRASDVEDAIRGAGPSGQNICTAFFG